MSLTTIPASLTTAVGEKSAEYHNYVLADGIIWAFSLIYHKQERFNWGHRVAHKGGYAVGFDTKTNSWGKPVEFDGLYEEENSEEILFEFNGCVYLLIVSGFREIAAHGLYRWTGSGWEKVELKAPSPLVLHEEDINVRVSIVDSHSTTDRYLVFSVAQDLRLYKLTFSSGKAELQPVGQIPVDQLAVIAPMATMGVQTGKRVLISYMTRGCGYMWNPDRFVTYNTETASFDHIHLPERQDSTSPPFGESGGGKGHWLSASGEWIHATGNSRVGMCGQQHEGGVWALQQLEGEPVWKKLALEIPDNLAEAVCFDQTSGQVYAVGKEAVGKATL